MECREIEIVYRRAKKNSELKRIATSSDVFKYCHEFITDDVMNLREYFFVVHLNRAGKVLGVQKVSEGGTAATTVDIKLVMGAALKSMAHSLILVHNHPSGSLNPSPEDDRLTRKIREAGNLLDIRVLDHLILSDEDYYSYCDNGRL